MHKPVMLPFIVIAKFVLCVTVCIVYTAGSAVDVLAQPPHTQVSVLGAAVTLGDRYLQPLIM